MPIPGYLTEMKHPDKPFGVNTAEGSSGFLLWQVTKLWQRGIKKSLDKIDITHPPFVLLASLLWLSKQKECVTQTDLSQYSKIDPMTTSTVIRTLLRKQLIERWQHHTDTRAKTISLTENGIKITRQGVKTMQRFDTSFFQSLGNKIQDFNIGFLTFLYAKKVSNRTRQLSSGEC